MQEHKDEDRLWGVDVGQSNYGKCNIKDHKLKLHLPGALAVDVLGLGENEHREIFPMLINIGKGRNRRRFDDRLSVPSQRKSGEYGRD